MAKQKNTQNIIIRLSRIDRRVLYVIILVCVVVPLLAGARMEMSVTSPVRGLYDAVDNLEPGSYVWLAADYDPGSMPELYPMNVSFVEHLFSRDIKIICAALWAPGPPLAQRVFDDLAAKYGKQYGVDYVNLGFKEGREAVMVSVAEDMRATFPEDLMGTRWESIPMLTDIENLEDVEMIICVSAVSGPEMYPYIQSGQLVGLLAGMKGAAEYEQLAGKPGLGISGMVAQSYVHVMVVIFIIFANVVYFIEKRRTA
jgi:hypothetical protein